MVTPYSNQLDSEMRSLLFAATDSIRQRLDKLKENCTAKFVYRNTSCSLFPKKKKLRNCPNSLAK
jgi:hypothetical protein